MLADELLHPFGGADGDRRLPDNECFAAQMRHERCDGRLHIAQIGAQPVPPLGCTHADEVDVAELGNVAVVGGEA